MVDFRFTIAVQRQEKGAAEAGDPCQPRRMEGRELVQRNYW